MTAQAEILDPGSTELAAHRDGERAPVAMTPMEMIAQAIETNQGVDVVGKLMDLQERWEANQARKAFNVAIAAAKDEIRPIFKNAKGHNTRYADLAQIARQVGPILSAHGLSYRFKTASNDGLVTVTCVLSHRDGHSEENALPAPPDKTGSKNDIQAIGSAVTYLQRYTLSAALGLSATDDNDGAGGPISEDQLDELIALADDAGADKAKFCEYMGVGSLSQILSGDFAKAKAALELKKAEAARKKSGAGQ